MNVAVLGSTRGTDLQAIIDAIGRGELDANIAVVISNKEDAFILERAKKHGIPAVFIPLKGKTREEFDEEVAKELEKRGVELVLLIGYMRYLSKPFVEKYRNRIMNVHPALLPAFAGGMDKSVHRAVLDAGVKVTGCTIHFVDEGADSGPIILQEAVPVLEGDDEDSLKARVQEAEGHAFIRAIRLFQGGKLRVEGNRVRILE
jgi:formyltetrahydrofolate-dependent phosphoribosylglycinamide formyltransferase